MYHNCDFSSVFPNKHWALPRRMLSSCTNGSRSSRPRSNYSILHPTLMWHTTQITRQLHAPRILSWLMEREFSVKISWRSDAQMLWAQTQGAAGLIRHRLPDQALWRRPRNDTLIHQLGEESHDGNDINQILLYTTSFPAPKPSIA